MEKKETRELNPEELNKVSGGSSETDVDTRCPYCRHFMAHIEGIKYCCINEKCWGYRVRVYVKPND